MNPYDWNIIKHGIYGFLGFPTQVLRTCLATLKTRGTEPQRAESRWPHEIADITFGLLVTDTTWTLHISCLPLQYMWNIVKPYDFKQKQKRSQRKGSELHSKTSTEIYCWMFQNTRASACQCYQCWQATCERLMSCRLQGTISSFGWSTCSSTLCCLRSIVHHVHLKCWGSVDSVDHTSKLKIAKIIKRYQKSTRTPYKLRTCTVRDALYVAAGTCRVERSDNRAICEIHQRAKSLVPGAGSVLFSHNITWFIAWSVAWILPNPCIENSTRDRPGDDTTELWPQRYF